MGKTTGITAHREETALSERGASAAKTLAALKVLGFTHVLMIPDSESRLLYQAIGDDPDLHLINPCREGESIAIAASLWTGGCKPLLVIQNTGFIEAGDALRGCGLGPKVISGNKFSISISMNPWPRLERHHRGKRRER